MEEVKDSKLRRGFRIIGPNTSDGKTSVWYSESLEDANRLAKYWAETNGAEYEIAEYVGSWKPKIPVEYIESKK